jgi:hypothetical protein
MRYVVAVGVWLLFVLGLWLFMQRTLAFKRRLEGLGVEVDPMTVTWIMLGDLVVNYWYVPAGVVLALCLFVANASGPRQVQKGGQ